MDPSQTTRHVRKGLFFAFGAFLIMNIKAATFQSDLRTPSQLGLAEPGVHVRKGLLFAFDAFLIIDIKAVV